MCHNIVYAQSFTTKLSVFMGGVVGFLLLETVTFVAVNMTHAASEELWYFFLNHLHVLDMSDPGRNHQISEPLAVHDRNHNGKMRIQVKREILLVLDLRHLSYLFKRTPERKQGGEGAELRGKRVILMRSLTVLMCKC